MENNEKKKSALMPISIEDVESKIVRVRGIDVIADADVARLYGVQTKEVNQAVRNNLDKFPSDYLFQLTDNESSDLRSKILTTKVSAMSRGATNVFTERGLYMLATILKGERARAVTFTIIETFYKVRNLKRELKELHQVTDKDVQEQKMKHFGEVLTDIVMPDLQTSETESQLELNFIIGKLKHTVKRTRKNNNE